MNYRILKLDAPDGEALSLLSGIFNACREAEPLSLSLPAGEPDTVHYVLFEEDGTAASVLSVCRLGRDLAEICAFTRLAARRRGYASALLSRAGKDLMRRRRVRPLTLIFRADTRAVSGVKALEALGFTREGAELEMSADLTPASRKDGVPAGRSASPSPAAFPDPELSAFLSKLSSGTDPDTGAETFLFPADDPVLSFSVIPWSAEQAYFLGFTVREDFRGKGAGSRYFPLILKYLSARGFRRVTLQVSADNTPAVRLYENAGLTAGVTLLTFSGILEP